MVTVGVADNSPLFEFSLEEFAFCDLEMRNVTRNLHENGPVGIMTDYEAKFYAEGMTINRLVATKVEATKDTKLGSAGRLRNAFLSDAKGHQEDNKE